MAYAFWKYDTYPFVLGGKVTKDFPDGTIETEEYGSGYRFDPKHIELNDERGAKLLADLKVLEKQFFKEKKELQQKFNNRLINEFPMLSACLGKKIQ